MAGRRSVQDDGFDSRLACGRLLPFEDLADLPQEEEVGEPWRRPREEAEGRDREKPVAEHPHGRHGAHEVGEERVEVRGEAVEARGQLHLAVAGVPLFEECRGVAPAVRRDEEHRPSGVRRELREGGRDRRLPDAALAGDHEEAPGEQAFEKGRRAHAGEAYARRRVRPSAFRIATFRNSSFPRNGLIIGDSSRRRRPTGPP